SCAMIVVPDLPSVRFDPVCSGNQQVLNRVFTRPPPERAATAASRAAECSARPPSTITTPSAVVIPTTFTPAPASGNKLQPKRCAVIRPAGVCESGGPSALCARDALATPPIAALRKVLRFENDIFVDSETRGAIGRYPQNYANRPPGRS